MFDRLRRRLRRRPLVSRATRKALTVAVLGAVVLAGLGASVVWDRGRAGMRPGTAVIVDQVRLTDPNPELIDRLNGTLASAGYDVTYVPADEVTVGFYRSLGRQGYELIILRTHATASNASGQITGPPKLFTSEAADTGSLAYMSERTLGQVGIVQLESGWGDLSHTRYWSVTPGLIQEGMEGRFGGATVLAMGCETMANDALAEAFYRRGAGRVVGWTESVTSAHNDAATQVLVQELVTKESRELAVESAFRRVDRDARYGGRLAYYSA